MWTTCAAWSTASGRRHSAASADLELRHGVPAHGRQDLRREPPDLVHEHLVGHGALVELQEQRAGAEGVGESDQRVAHVGGRAPAEPLVALQILHGHAPEALERAQEVVAILGPQPAEALLAHVAALPLRADVEEVAVAEQ